MNILISSRSFYPSLGGSETDAEILAREFTCLRHKVRVVTQTPGSNVAADGLAFPFQVIRQPSPIQLLQLVRWCDVYFHNGISLRDAWPLLLTRKPWILRHQTWIQRPQEDKTSQPTNWNTHLKLFLTKFATSISISKAIAQHLNSPSTIIPNPYRDHLFHLIPDLTRHKELVFLGRLVSDKGVDLLLEALASLRDHQLIPQLTIVGSGPEDANLRQKTVNLNLAGQVDFIGPKIGEELVSLLNQHQIMVVPSLWAEPFGVVALEGIACGCVVVGSKEGGLTEAIGPCGVTFPNGNAEALAQVLKSLLECPEHLSKYRACAVSHLLRHQQAEVAKLYLKVFEEAIYC